MIVLCSSVWCDCSFCCNGIDCRSWNEPDHGYAEKCATDIRSPFKTGPWPSLDNLQACWGAEFVVLVARSFPLSNASLMGAFSKYSFFRVHWPNLACMRASAIGLAASARPPYTSAACSRSFLLNSPIGSTSKSLRKAGGATQTLNAAEWAPGALR